jgi:tetratricopeptide (TPR) repeat protein
MELYRQALEIYTKTLGEDNSMWQTHTYNTMANVLKSQGILDNAMVLYEKALEIYKRNLGEEHLSVANTYNMF